MWETTTKKIKNKKKEKSVKLGKKYQKKAEIRENAKILVQKHYQKWGNQLKGVTLAPLISYTSLVHTVSLWVFDEILIVGIFPCILHVYIVQIYIFIYIRIYIVQYKGAKFMFF